MRNFLMLLMLVSMAAPLTAALNHTFPRTRTFSEIGRPKERVVEGSTRRRSVSTHLRDIDFGNKDAYDIDKLRFGASVEYVSNFLYRDFAINESGANAAFNVYGSFYGIEASVFALSDMNEELNTDQPMFTAMRLGYTFKYQTSINTVAFTYQDWSNSTGQIGTTSQGFGTNPPIFEDEAMEVNLESTWFTDTIQPNNMNLFLGFKADVWIDEPGFRTAVTAGVFSNKQGDGSFLPNGARLQGSLYFQSNYHTDTTSAPGVEAYGEAYWDFRYGGETVLPLMIVLYGQYYLPLDADPVDLLTFGFRVELAF